MPFVNYQVDPVIWIAVQFRERFAYLGNRIECCHDLDTVMRVHVSGDLFLTVTLSIYAEEFFRVFLQFTFNQSRIGDGYDGVSFLFDGERGRSASRKAFVDDRVRRDLFQSVRHVLIVGLRILKNVHN